ncbi:MAG: DUF2625 domain-containing protein [Ferruginibacter sp.]
MKKIFFLIFLLHTLTGFTQHKLRKLQDLLNVKDHGWPFVQQMIDSATNKVDVLPGDSATANDALYKMQVTTRSPMGAVIHKTGGIMIDNGWIRILGSGSKKIVRSVPDWNKGKTLEQFGEESPYLLIADDAVGGFFAINGGRLGKDKGKAYYLSPDRLLWEPLNMTYSQFLFFCFSGDLNKFYEKLRWNNWKKDVVKLDGNKVFSFYPYLWTTEGKDINKNKKKKIQAEEQFQFNMQSRKQLGLEKEARL